MEKRYLVAFRGYIVYQIFREEVVARDRFYIF